jgi:hypothetical protein
MQIVNEGSINIQFVRILYQSFPIDFAFCEMTAINRVFEDQHYLTHIRGLA